MGITLPRGNSSGKPPGGVPVISVSATFYILKNEKIKILIEFHSIIFEGFSQKAGEHA
jgi:hypothetical protein